MSKVSIILPIYNGEQTLQSTVESLLSQTFKDFNLYACIDGSSDSSEFILQSFGDARIHIIKNERNLGLARSLNRLMGCIDPESVYVAMAEQDDWYYPYRLEKQVSFLDAHPEYGLVSGVAEFYSGDDRPIPLFPGVIANGGSYPEDCSGRAFFLYNYREQIKVVNTCMMFRRSVYNAFGLYFDAHFPNVSIDWAFVLRFSYFSRVYSLRDILVRMDRREKRASITTDKTKQYRTTYELLRFFKFERPDFITNGDYRYALMTQRLLELGGAKYVKRVFLLFFYCFFYPTDRRPKERLVKELRRIYKK